jgi:hypothetical protein
MSTPEETLKVYENINIASFAVTVPCLAFWLGLLWRMLVSKYRDKFQWLIVICILMIVG